jgi:nicotinamide mononucleotide transporter
VLEEILTGLRATSPLEAISVVLGLAYSVLAVRRSRYCWVAGACSSAILAYLSARGRLPMQALLQGYYVLVSVYGFWHWSGSTHGAVRAVGTWPLRAHLLAGAGVLVASLLTAHWLAAQTQAAWPYLDSATTWASLVATWLVARMKLENWLYWIAIDAASIVLFGAQHLYFVALLFAAYLVISAVGFLAWLKDYRMQAQPA